MVNQSTNQLTYGDVVRFVDNYNTWYNSINIDDIKFVNVLQISIDTFEVNVDKLNFFMFYQPCGFNYIINNEICDYFDQIDILWLLLLTQHRLQVMD